ncbi:MAG: phage portal protein [Oscillospiraceae bacterium]|nr:phage portal protein [Oscillospiraceae bacterium]
MNALQKLFKRKTEPAQGISLEIQSGFTAFSGTAYGSAAFRGAVDAIARHTAKLQAHCDRAGVENLLQNAPNPYMTAYDLLYKTATAYYSTNNAFILIQRDRDISAFYPLTPASVEFIGAQDGTIYARLIFADGKDVLLPYADLIHLRRHYSTNELLGSDNAPLYPLIDTAHTLTEATGAAVKNATNIRGVLKFTSLVNPAQVKAEKEQFVSDYFNPTNNGGIAATDQRFEFVPTAQTAYNVPSELTESVNKQIFAYLGVSPKIVAGEYTEDEFAAFYESLIEPLAIQMSLEFSRKCGAEIKFTAERLEFSSAATRISLLRELLPFGVVSINEARRLLSLPEVPDGEKRLQSLNYVAADKADAYQLEESEVKQNAEPDADTGV